MWTLCLSSSRAHIKPAPPAPPGPRPAACGFPGHIFCCVRLQIISCRPPSESSSQSSPLLPSWLFTPRPSLGSLAARGFSFLSCSLFVSLQHRFSFLKSSASAASVSQPRPMSLNLIILPLPPSYLLVAQCPGESSSHQVHRCFSV